jgi:hypothetical protein
VDLFSDYWRVGLGIVFMFLVWWWLSQRPVKLGLYRTEPPRHTKLPTLLTASLPEFAGELRRLLTEEGKLELASKVPQLKIVDRCRCGDDFCSTFYTRPKPEATYGPDHYTVVLSPTDGMVNVDVAEGEIACVEVLYRDDVKAKLQVALP